ncbi:MAG TPA: DUF2752 domain-containing protein [Pyrinomonadaceae bacterium]|mgnify:CR=1 FL=1|nr:DUF2752 domain-containing protein [Pyrinomonadaceae bacterium]
MFETVIKYISNHKIFLIVGGYFFLSAILKAITDIDVCLPCLWKYFFGVDCPGCGLTTALISLMKLDVVSAFNSNPLIFILIPAGLYYLKTDYAQFTKKYYAQQHLPA